MSSSSSILGIPISWFYSGSSFNDNYDLSDDELYVDESDVEEEIKALLRGLNNNEENNSEENKEEDIQKMFDEFVILEEECIQQEKKREKGKNEQDIDD